MEYRSCSTYSTRGFHNWRWLGWPLTSTSCQAKWCEDCSLLKKADSSGVWKEAGYRNRPLEVGEVRQQCALMDSGEPVLIKMGDRYFKALRAWPDTAQSPRGRAFYIEVEEDEYREVSL